MRLPGPVYPILDTILSRKMSQSHSELLRLWDSLGLKYYQLRAKDLTSRDYEKTARNLKKEFPCLHLIANDYLEIAMENRETFSGIHIGQEDKSVLKARLMERMFQEKDFITGISTHSFLQLEKETAFPWSYTAFGPLFSTHSKENPSVTVTAEEIGRVLDFFAKGDRHERQDLVFIGGISAGNFRQKLPVNCQEKYGFQPAAAVIQTAMSAGSLKGLLELYNG